MVNIVSMPDAPEKMGIIPGIPSSLKSPIGFTDGRYTIQGIPLSDIVEQFGSATYVYDLDFLKEQFHYFSKVVCGSNSRFKIHYAMKANGEPHVLQTLAEAGAYVDTTSPAEVLLGLKNGFTEDRILFTANSLTDEAIAFVQNRFEGRVLMNFDSLDVLERYGKAFQGNKVCLRFNPDVVAGEDPRLQTAGAKTKFGIALSDAAEAKKIADAYGLTVVGLHEHTGSGISDKNALLKSMDNLMSVAHVFPDLRFVDFGGGFKATYKPDEKPVNYESLGDEILDKLSDFSKKFGHDLDVYLEPGKYIVAQCGVFLASVTEVRQREAANGEVKRFVCVDASSKQFARPSNLMDNGNTAYHHILIDKDPHCASQNEQEYDVVGNLCLTGDLFANNRKLSDDVRPGDVIAILNGGAYCYEVSSIFNMVPSAAIVVVKDGKASLVKARESYEKFIEKYQAEYTEPQGGYPSLSSKQRIIQFG
ncbi:MAG: diaminopimelate decarboxylase [Bdellovibrionales bacterium]